MAITYSYPKATPEIQDLLIGTEMAVQGGEDAPRTRTFTVGSIIDLAVISFVNSSSNIYAPKLNPVFSGTVTGVTKAMVGLSNVDNTTDLLKPISTATQTALNLKANIASPTFTGVVTTNTITVATTSDNVVALNVDASGTNSTGISSNSNYIGVKGISTEGKAIEGSSYSGIGVYGSSYSGVGASVFSYLGRGIEVYCNGNNIPSVEVNLGNTNRGLVINSGTSSTGYPILIDKNGVDKLVVNQEGELTATKLIKQGGLSSEYLMADGNARVHTVTNSTQTTAFTVTTLNSVYPTATIGFTVQCTNGAVLKSYQKTSTGWISYIIANVA